MQILLANPRGFCAGVDRAISIVENALAIYGAPIYVRHEVVHNRYVVDSLRERGAIFIEQISEVPDGAILIFSAHGVSQAVRNEAKSRDLTVFDATCPLVTKVHMEVARASRRGEESILIGHAGHPEVQRIIETSIRRIRAAGKAAGFLAVAPDMAQQCLAWGANFVAVGVDTMLYSDALDQRLAMFKSGKNGPRIKGSY